jgi:hypothetical protein
MLTSIVKATRAHYAALQHQPAADRTPLHYAVYSKAAIGALLTSGTVHVKVETSGRRRMEMTKLQNRLSDMFPEANEIEVSYEA